MLRMLIYPPSSNLAFLPAAYQQPPASAAITISNSSIMTLCQTVTMYTDYLKATMSDSVSVSCGTSGKLPYQYLQYR